MNRTKGAVRGRCRSILLSLAAAVSAMAASPAAAQPVAGHAARALVDLVPAGQHLVVTSGAFADQGDLPLAATQFGANRFPGLAWSAGPAGTRRYVVVVQGMLPAGGTSVHLLLGNIPAGTTSLAASLATIPAGAAYGANVHGPAAGYAGPHPHGRARQAYRFQVLALDTELPAAALADIGSLAAAVRGHVLAAGETTAYATMPLRPAVRIDTGLVAGVAGRDAGVTVYRGIPYAAPPVGALRWRAPAPAKAWTGVRIADRFGPLCPQPATDVTPAGAMSEDCLSLNVWTPAARRGARLPVYVWIYGGGFIAGSGSSAGFDGEGLARKGVIVVTFNYRLGVLGFLATPELSRESGHGASGNYGLLDDVAALQWVRRNIAAFGGDPARVTIGGQSAGAGSVGFMTMSPLARGLFRTAIAESHARYPRDPDLRFLSVSYRALPDAERAGAAYARAHGAEGLAALRALPWQQVIAGSETIDAAVDTGTGAKPPLFRPVVDGWVVPQGYAATLAARTQARVIYVAGNNRDETGGVPETAFAALRARTTPPRAGMPQVSVTLADFQRNARAKYRGLADDFLALYPARTDDEAARASNQAAWDANRVSTWLWAGEWRKGVTLPVYTYWWSHAPPGPDAAMRGAYHGSEINYAFGNLDANDRPWSSEDRRIAETMSSYWANIVKYGDPNASGLPRWPAYRPEPASVMELGNAWRPIAVATPERIAFWRRYYATQEAW